MFCCLIVVDFNSMCCFFFFKQKTAYEMRISDWSSDVCSSDLVEHALAEEDVADAEDVAQHHHHELQQHHRQRQPAHRRPDADEIGRASCRERVCQYV